MFFRTTPVLSSGNSAFGYCRLIAPPPSGTRTRTTFPLGARPLSPSQRILSLAALRTSGDNAYVSQIGWLHRIVNLLLGCACLPASHPRIYAGFFGLANFEPTRPSWQPCPHALEQGSSAP